MKSSLFATTFLALTLAALLRHRCVKSFIIYHTITTNYRVRFSMFGTTAIYNDNMMLDDEGSGNNDSNNHVVLENDDEATVCLITGASRGIGKCIALELFKARKNAKIIVNDIESMKVEMENVSLYS